MEKTVQQELARKTGCELTKLKPEPEFENMFVSGMKFDITAVQAEGLGRVALMRAKGFFGLMKMNSLMITPSEKDAPLIAFERMQMMGKDIFYVEAYDTTVGGADTAVMAERVKCGADIPDTDPGSHWYDSIVLPGCVYKKGKMADKTRLDTFETEMLDACFEMLREAPACDPAAKTAANRAYVDGLLQNGGPSTDLFVKKYGTEKTGRLFREYLFGL